MNTYARLPVAFSHGQGSRITDTEGKEYLDALSGIAVSTLGHAHPKLVAAIAAQAGRVLHTSNLYGITGQEQLADKLCERSGMQEVFFCNSGCEANEAAIKLARFYGHKQGIESPTIIVMEKAFHGRTMATLSATGNRKTQAGFEPLVHGFLRVPYDDLEAIKSIAEHNNNIVAVMLEIIQGEGGIHLASIEFQKGLRQLCDEKGWLLICDEVQCGMGRTGKWFAHQWAGIKPDVMPLAKGLGSGVPIGAVVAGPRAANIFQPGNHGTTFGGNPLAMRAGVETIRIMEEDELLANAATVGAHLKAALQAALGSLPGVKEVRGQGLMLGVELAKPCGVLVGQAAEAGLLISVTAESVIRIVPPLILTTTEADEIVARLTQTYAKPAFGLTTTQVGDETVAVNEEILLRKPFGQLLHFRRDTTRRDPKVLVVAPMSGHFATLHTHIDDLVESLRLVTPRGVVATRRLPASGAGPAPDRWFIGSEGALGVITEAWVRLAERPRFRASATLAFTDFLGGAGFVRAVAQAGLYPANLRVLDPLEALMNGAGTGQALALLAFESADHPLGAWLEEALRCARDHGATVLAQSQKEEPARVHGASERAPGAEPAEHWRAAFLRAPYLRDALVQRGLLVETFETAVTWDRFPAFHKAVTAATERAIREVCGRGLLTCRLTHAYPDGVAPYYTVVAPARRGAELEQWAAIKDAATEALLTEGGTTTHHHAVGRDFRPYYERERDPLFGHALSAVKRALDPEGLLNPGVLLAPGAGPP